MKGLKRTMKYSSLNLSATWLLCYLLVLSCNISMKEVHTLLEGGDAEAALAYMEDKSPRRLPRRLFLLEKGLVAHYANRFSDSNMALSGAEEAPDDYRDSRFEKLLNRYYRVLNYVYLNQMPLALQECRRARDLIDGYEDENYVDFGAGLLAHLSGLCFEAAGEWYDAFLSYRQAETHYQHAGPKTEVKMPADIGDSLVRLARRLGFADEAGRYQRQYGEPRVQPERAGELILFYESGYVPARGKELLKFPILEADLENDVFDEDNRENKDAARRFVVDTLLHRKGKSYSASIGEDYVRVAVAATDSNRPRMAGVMVQASNLQERGALIGDIEAMAMKETLNARHPTLLIPRLIDDLLDYVVYRAKMANWEERSAARKRRQRERLADAKEVKDADELSAIDKIKLTKLLEVAETVDRREYRPSRGYKRPFDTHSWITLPNQIFLVRMPLQQGVHNVKLLFLDANGRAIHSHILRDVEIYSNRKTFLNYRTYD